ncbi:MAG: AI-2E family transporter [Oscillospiraceae bacterium]
MQFQSLQFYMIIAGTNILKKYLNERLIMQLNNEKVYEFVQEIKAAGKGLLKSQLILSSMTLMVITIGLTIFEIKYAFLIAIGITLVDLIPVIGSGVVMLPWAAYLMIFGDNMDLGIKIALLYIGLSVVREILEPIIRGKSLGLSPVMTAVSCILGFIIFNGVGLIIGPVIAILGQIVYKIFYKRKEITDGRE